MIFNLYLQVKVKLILAFSIDYLSFFRNITLPLYNTYSPDDICKIDVCLFVCFFNKSMNHDDIVQFETLNAYRNGVMVAYS